MLNLIIRFSLNNRLLILILSLILVIYGSWITFHLPIDVFPDLNRPIVTILTESHGLAPEEVETLVTLPIETVLNGTPGVMRIRSSSGIGISIIYVEFEWGTEIYRNRQLIAERLQLAMEKLPENISPVMGPVSSIMGEIQFVGLTTKKNLVNPMELRTLADWSIRPRLMTIPGISQVVVMGGQVKQFQILVSSDKLQKKLISLEQLKHTLAEISQNTTGGFIDIGEKEFLIRPLGRVETQEEIENSTVGMHLGEPVLVKDVAIVVEGAKTKRGEGSINGENSVVMTIQKQPGASTIELTQKIDHMINDIKKTLPQGIEIQSDLFKQSRFIEASISNVEEALRDGAIMVAIILFLFLMNIRTTAITLISIPLSLLTTFIIFKFLDLSINTMTLGGLAIAMGELVDDAIVDVENVFRRLKENRALLQPVHPLLVIYRASSEVRNSIVFSTMIVVLVFIPLFALSGIEGKLFAPLGIAYIISLLASLLISLTVTPVLCYFLVSKSQELSQREDGLFVKKIKAWNEQLLRKTLYRPKKVILFCLGLFLFAICLIPFMGSNFLPPFNEGTATIGVAAAPGISLSASNELGSKVEKAILSVPETKSTIRRTGRAEMDEHAEGVHWSEIDVDFKENTYRTKSEILHDIRKKIEAVGNVYINIGQPISHRLDHLLSGVRAQIAIKVFGPDLIELRQIGVQVESALKNINGIVDLQLEPLVQIPQLKILIDREETNKFGIGPGMLAKDLEMALNGENVGQMISQQQLYNVFMRLDNTSRSTPQNIENIIIKTMPTGKLIKVSDVANVYQGLGPNMVNRENLQKRIVVSANASGKDLGTLIKEIKFNIDKKIKLPEGYYLEYGGQFESQQKASRLILFLALISLIGIFLLLYGHFRSSILALQIMINVPLALIGSIIAVFCTEKELSVASMIAFITLCGIATRNGIMMIDHYLHLVREEGETFSDKMVIRGSLERLVPVLMTALSAILALIPLTLTRGEPGKEILYPVAVVIIGGLLSSTLLDIFVTPTLFFNYAQKAVKKIINSSKEEKFNL